MKIYLAAHPSGRVSFCDWPIKERGARHFAKTITKSDWRRLLEYSKKWEIVDGEPVLVASDDKKNQEQRVADAIKQNQENIAARKAIKAKLEADEITLSDVKNALKQLL